MMNTPGQSASTNTTPDICLEVLSQPRFLAPVREMVNSLTKRIGFSDSNSSQISLAVEEALCNIINHGYQKKPNERIWLKFWASTGPKSPMIRIVIEDQARQVEPSTIKPRPLEEIRPGGLGVHIMREVMDEVTYEKRDAGGMKLTMTKREHK